MENFFTKVAEFNKSFNIPQQNEFQARIPDDNEFLYSKLLTEENMEYAQAVLDRDRTEVADALGDEMYVLIGKIIKHGMTFEQFSAIFNEIHESNMSKLGEDGKPIYREDGKVLKGPNYFKPNVEKFI
jgi:predicted HAD superfamily Cof-like phosphohydrolase